jgi:CheY-like chemotaxis protein
MDKSIAKVPRALIVDDHPLVRTLTAKAVEHFGFEVADFAQDGEEAVMKARTCLPDFIVMDQDMPKMDGITATRQILAERHVPILICTGVISAELMADALRAGAYAVLVKPCPSDRLREHLGRLFPVYA